MIFNQTNNNAGNVINASGRKLLYHLTHTDGRDYYVTHHEDLGFFSTRELALEAIKADDFDGPLDTEATGTGEPEVYYSIDECQLLVDGKPIVWEFEEPQPTPER